MITVSGLLTNTSKAAVRGWVVQLYASATPVTSSTVIGPGTVPFYEFPGIQPLAGARWRSGQIQPGQSVRWQIRFRARKVGMTQFGVYPLAAVAHNRAGAVLGASTSYLPYMPAKKSPYSATRPDREQISWLWPLIGKPLLGPPWQNACTGPQARALARSLSPGGRLANLVAVGQRRRCHRDNGPAGQRKWPAESAQGKAARGEPAAEPGRDRRHHLGRRSGPACRRQGPGDVPFDSSRPGPRSDRLAGVGVVGDGWPASVSPCRTAIRTLWR